MATVDMTDMRKSPLRWYRRPPVVKALFAAALLATNPVPVVVAMPVDSSPAGRSVAAGGTGSAQVNPASRRATVVRPALSVVVAGLPIASRARITVTGRRGWQRVISYGTLTRLRPGGYTVTAPDVRIRGRTYRATRRVQRVGIGPGAWVRVHVRYVAVPAAPARPAPPPLTSPSSDGAPRYDLGNPALSDVWVDPVNGRDDATGADRQHPLASVSEAWRRIPARTVLVTGIRLQLVAGRYAESALPSYWESRWGTPAAPVVVNSADGPGRAVLEGEINAADIRHVAFVGLDVTRSGGAFHCERCSYVLLRRMHLSAGGVGQETIKANQSDHLYVEDSDVEAAAQNPLDYVAVQYGHIVGNRIHGAGDWCAYVKGGSAYLLVSDNEIFDCDTGGFSAGQGTGFEYMVPPWLHYETYGVTVVNNVVHDTVGAGLGVNGSFGTVMAYNTLFRVGSRSHAVEFVHGARSCDGDAGACAARLAAGGWGVVGGGGQWIPNRHVRFVNNVVVNPVGLATAWSHFAVAPAVTPPTGSGVPAPSRADDDLVIRGNVIVDGAADHEIGFGPTACDDANPVCNRAAVLSENAVNTVAADFVSPAGLDLRPLPGSALATTAAVPVPGVRWEDMPARPTVPAGPPDLVVPPAHDGTPRAGWGRPGAY